MKRFMALFTALALTFALAGCGGQQASGSSDGSGSSGGGEITILGNARMYEGEEAAWEEVTADFEEQTGIHVNIRWQGTWDEVPQNLSAAKMAGESVDLVTVGAGLINASVAASGMLMDITDLMEPYRQYFNDGMLDSYTIGDRLWGFPYGNSASSFIYYNKDLFDQLGIEEATTYDELVKISQVISDNGLIPMVYRGKDPSYWAGWFFSTYAQETDNTSIDNIKAILSGEQSFNDEKVMNALDDIKAFWNDGIVTDESLDMNGDAMKATFFQQDAAMLLTHNFQILPDQCEFELGLMEFPLVVDDGVAYSQPSGGPGTGIAIPSFADRDNLDNTMKFVEFLLQPENANKIIQCYNPVVDVVKGVEVLDLDIVRELNEDLTPKTITYLDWIWPAQITDAFAQVIPSMLAGDMDSAQGAQLLQDTLDTIVEQDGYVFEWWNSWTEDDWAQVTP